METHKLAIVILNYNGINFLKKFMSNTVKHSEKFAIYVIDNNSSDDSLKYLNDEFPNVKIIKNFPSTYEEIESFFQLMSDVPDAL